MTTSLLTHYEEKSKKTIEEAEKICDESKEKTDVVFKDKEKNDLDIRLIYAQDCLGGIGFNGGIPWHSKIDLKRFKQLTEGGCVLMGSKTWNSIPAESRPLKNRINIVFSRQIPIFTKEENLTYYIKSDKPIDFILGCLKSFREPIWIIGGAYLYDLFLPYANTIERTLVYGAFKCDTFVKPIDLMQWQCMKKESHIENSRLIEFETFKRK